VLKYVSKGVELSDNAVTELARLKYIRTAGFLYAIKEPTYELICADCGAKCYPVFDFDPIQYPDPPPERKLKMQLIEKQEDSLVPNSVMLAHESNASLCNWTHPQT
jgi:hypothetical protein